MEATEILKKVRKIEIKTKNLSKHLFSGEYHSAFKGRGMSFSEVREYQYGDDVRNIDWNVTARTGDPHIKIFEEDRELTIMLLVDISGSSNFGTGEQFKKELMIELSAVLAFAAVNNHDKVGAILFTDKVEKYIPPKKGKKHILRLIRELLYHEPDHTGTDLTAALEYFHNVCRKRSICFVLSDFATSDYEKALMVAAKRHDVIGMHIKDSWDNELPKIGLLSAVDPETGQEIWVDTSDAGWRDNYMARIKAQEQYFEQSFIKSKSDRLTILAGEDYIKPLLSFFKQRSK